MKTNGAVIFIAVLLIAGSVHAQETEISRLKTHTITLSRKAPKDKNGPPQLWTLVAGEIRQMSPVEFKSARTRDDIGSSGDVPTPGQVQVTSKRKNQYSIRYAGFSMAGDDQWLQLYGAPVGGMGLLKDLGEMNWAEIDRMPDLELQPITGGVSLSVIQGERIVGPQGFVVRALAGHVYAVHVKDDHDHTDFRAIFRVESFESNKDCNISWKRIPSKWVAGPGANLQAKQPKANVDAGKQPKTNVKDAKVVAAYTGPPASEILSRAASVYAQCRTYSDEGFIGLEGAETGGSHFRTTFSRPNTLGFELWQGGREPWVVWKKGNDVSNWRPDGVAGRPAPFDTALGQLAVNSKGGSLLVPPLLLPSLFRTADAFALLTGARVVGENKVDGLEVFRVKGTLLGQQIELWIDKTQYLIRKVVRTITAGTQQFESITYYKPKLNVDIPTEKLTYKPPAGTVSASAVNSMPVKGQSPGPPLVAPRLRREFGSSLSRRPNEKAIEGKRSGDEDVVRVETDLVMSSVLVLDPQGKIVSGLTKEDFIVKEDNNLQQVASFSLSDNKELPRSFVLIIDYSPSQLPYIRTSIEAAKTLVDKLNPSDRMALVTDDVQLITDFTSDKTLLKEKLDGLKSSALSGVMGASLQYDALMATLTELFNNEDTQPIVIFQTDGDQLDALKGANAALGPYAFPRKYGLEDILTATERARATIYPVISGVRFLGVPESEVLQRSRLDVEKRRTASRELREAQNAPGPTGPALPVEALQRNADRWFRCQRALAELAKSAGAWAEFLEEPDQADEIYTRVLANIQLRYVVGYYPTNRTRDGKRRTVSVQVKNHPEYVVVGHKSYLAREE